MGKTDRKDRDRLEAWTNAIVGLAFSAALVAILRAVGLWDAPIWVVAPVFFSPL